MSSDGFAFDDIRIIESTVPGIAASELAKLKSDWNIVALRFDRCMLSCGSINYCILVVLKKKSHTKGKEFKRDNPLEEFHGW